MGHNKFLSTYPSLWSPEVGDKVVMTSNNRPYWNKWDVGTICTIYIGYEEPIYHINFHNYNNKKAYAKKTQFKQPK